MGKSNVRMKVLVFWAITLVSVLFLVEVTSYIASMNFVPARIRGRAGRGGVEFHVAIRRKAHFFQTQLVKSAVTATSRGISTQSDLLMFNSVLGWDYPPDMVYRDFDGVLYRHGPAGERRTCTAFPTTAIATYGDSFTYCSQVRDNQTWQTFLAEKLGTNILNFGVGGYGTDQALLKYQLHARSSAKIVMLCILPENINRIVNIYRPFYQYNDPLALTKPLFVRDGRSFKLLPNPLQNTWDVGKLDDPTFIERLGKLDYWYRLDKELPPLRFPYGLSLVRWREPMLDELSFDAARILPFHSKIHYPWNLFEEAEPLAVMCHIVDMFVKTALTRGATPIIVIMPHTDFVREIMDYRVSRVEKLLGYLKMKQYRVIDLVQAMADMQPTRAQLEKWFDGHATAAGNKVIAEILARNLDRSSMYRAQAQR